MQGCMYTSLETCSLFTFPKGNVGKQQKNLVYCPFRRLGSICKKEVQTKSQNNLKTGNRILT